MRNVSEKVANRVNNFKRVECNDYIELFKTLHKMLGLSLFTS
jgi:hypothetical protein